MSFTTVLRPHRQAAKTTAPRAIPPRVAALRAAARGSRPILHLKPAVQD